MLPGTVIKTDHNLVMRRIVNRKGIHFVISYWHWTYSLSKTYTEATKKWNACVKKNDERMTKLYDKIQNG